MSALLPGPGDVQYGYRLRRLRGTGSFGQVWEADSPDGRKVAFKMVQCKPGVAGREVRNTHHVSQLSHPNLVYVEKVWCERNQLIFVMELGEGSFQDLAEVSRNEFGTTLPARLLCGYFSQIADAIDFLNARKHMFGGIRVGVQHCDIKPSNLLLFGEVAKLCDFGLSTTLAGPTIRYPSGGTPAYAAPEVYRGWLSDWSDQYALAMTYCHLRGGRLPFAEIPTEFRSDFVRPNPDLGMLDEAEQPIIARALSQVPQERWPSCGALFRQLASILPAQAPAGPAERRTTSRQACPHQPVLKLAANGMRGGVTASVVNVSRQGLGLVLDRGLRMGTNFVFMPPIVRVGDSNLLSGRVVRGVQQADGTWFVGCHLAFPLKDAELEAITRQRRRPAAE